MSSARGNASARCGAVALPALRAEPSHCATGMCIGLFAVQMPLPSVTGSNLWGDTETMSGCDAPSQPAFA